MTASRRKRYVVVACEEEEDGEDVRLVAAVLFGGVMAIGDREEDWEVMVSFVVTARTVSLSWPFVTVEEMVWTQAWRLHCLAQGCRTPGWPDWDSVPMKTSFIIVE
jgi:hypothetical protein